MNKIEKETHNRSFTFIYALREMVLINSMMIEYWIIRDRFKGKNLPGINIFVDSVHIPQEMDTINKDTLLSSIECRASTDLYICTFYSDSLPWMTEKKKVEIISYKEYHRMIYSNIKSNKIMSRFSPFSVDMEFKDNSEITWPFIGKNLKDSDIKMSESMRVATHELIGALKMKKKVQEDESSKISLVTLSRITTDLTHNMTMKGVRLYLKGRHDLFAMRYMTRFGYDSPLDLDLVKEFGYVGVDSHKTPDVVKKNEKGVLEIIDFAVTEGNTETIVKHKFDKYNRLSDGLSSFLKIDTIVKPVVYNIRDPYSSYIPGFEFEDDRANFLESLQDMKMINERMLENEDYKEMKVRFEFNEDEDDLDEKKRMMELLSEILLTKIPENIRASSMSYSRDEGPKMSVKNDEDMILMDILTKYSKFDEKKIFHNILDTLSEINRDGSRTKLMERIITVKDKEISDMADEIMKKERMLGVENYKQTKSIPKLFKYPLFSKKMEMSMLENIKSYEYESMMADGTIIMSSAFERMNEETEDTHDVNREGIHIHPETDRIMMDAFEMMTEESSEEFQQKMKNSFEIDSDQMDQMMKLKIFEYFHVISELFTNIAYMEGRRWINKEEGMKKSHTIMKDFGNYSIMIKKGSALTKEKIIWYKLFTNKNNIVSMPFLHSWIFMENHAETRWLSTTLVDMGHFMMLFNKAVGLMSHYIDMEKESNTAKVNLRHASYIYPLMVLAEHKRGTSTTLQLNRYLFHSATGLLSDKKGLINTIMEDPVRSILESFCRKAQLVWYKTICNEGMSDTKKAIRKRLSTTTDYDTLTTRAFFGSEKLVNFSWTMVDMYLGNLLNKDHGFSTHRSKAIIMKMVKEEINFLKVRKNANSKGEMMDRKAFMLSEDIHHTFDMDFVFLAGKRLWAKLEKTGGLEERLYNYCTQTIDSAMMMTSSLVGVPEETVTLKKTDHPEKRYSFLTIQEKVSELGTNTLLGMISSMDIIEAYFDLFPKAQIGGPREILIMAVTLRIQVKAVESIASNLCDLHPKEMLTKDSRKTSIQSDTMEAYRKKAMMVNSKKMGMVAIPISINTDASKWAPSMVMEQFLCFIAPWKIDDKLKNFMFAVIRGFSDKKMYLPKALIDNWKKKPEEELEQDEGIQWIRERAEKEGWCPVIHSGMGQGMLHFLSSLYHCAVDDIMDSLISEVLFCKLEVTTLISSDDKTKMCLFYMESKVAVMEKCFYDYACMFDSIQRLANIHVNWKKTAFNLLICEFNSVFSTGKTVVLATSKFIYSAIEVVDLTIPEQAVLSVVSNIQRVLFNGAYMTTVNIIMALMRRWLKDSYRLDEKVSKDLCSMLNTEEKYLPHHMGYLPLDMPIETLMYGPDVTMYRPENSFELMQFYRNIYTGKNDIMKSDDSKQTVESPSTGKIRYELPTRLNKKMKKIKNEYYSDKDLEEIRKNSNKTCLLRPSKLDMDHFSRFTDEYFDGGIYRYEFQETMRIHSVVRALAMSTSSGFCMEFGKEERMDILYFCNKILSRTKESSFFDLTKGLKSVVEANQINKKKLSLMCRSENKRHPKLRSVRFFVTKMWDDFTESEIIDCMMSDIKWTSTRIMESTKTILSFFGKDYKDVLKNPLMAIKEMFPNSARPFSDFKDFLSYNKKVLFRTSAMLLMDFPDTGSMETNLLYFYRYRTNPSYVLDTGRRDIGDTKPEDFLSYVSMCGTPFHVMMHFMDKERAEFYSREDKSLITLMKLCYNSLGGYIDFSETKSDKVLFRESYDKSQRLKYYDYFSFNFFSRMTIDSKKKIIMVFSESATEDMKMLETVSSLMRRDISILESEGYSTKSYFSKSDNYYDFGMSDLGIFCNIKTIRGNIKFSFYNSVWKAHLTLDTRVGPVTFQLYTDNYMINPTSINKFTDENMMFDMLEMMTGILSLKELYFLFKKYNWINDKKLNTVREKTTEEEEKKITSADIGNFMNPSSLFGDESGMSLFANGFFTEAMSEFNLAYTSMQEEEKSNGMDVKGFFDGEDGGLFESLANMDFNEMSKIEEVLPSERFSMIWLMSHTLDKAIFNELGINRFMISKVKDHFGPEIMFSFLFKQVEQIIQEMVGSEIEQSFTLMVYSRICSTLIGSLELYNAMNIKYIMSKDKIMMEQVNSKKMVNTYGNTDYETARRINDMFYS